MPHWRQAIWWFETLREPEDGMRREPGGGSVPRRCTVRAGGWAESFGAVESRLHPREGTSPAPGFHLQRVSRTSLPAVDRWCGNDEARLAGQSDPCSIGGELRTVSTWDGIFVLRERATPALLCRKPVETVSCLSVSRHQMESVIQSIAQIVSQVVAVARGSLWQTWRILLP